MDRKLYGKVIFKGVIKSLTGLHIGGSKETLEIGGLDAPVIKHPVTGEPYIPGSSLKGKLRSLLEMKLHTEEGIEFSGSLTRLHVCKNYNDAINCKVCRVFGASGDTNFPARIRVRDANLTEFSRKFIEGGLEVKFENSLDRITSASNPRQIERVPADTEFNFEIIYNVEDLEHLKEDLNNLLSSMELLEDDALGGHVSRGYGRVKFYFSEIVAKPVSVYFGEGKSVEIMKEKWDIEEPVRENIPDIQKVKHAIVDKLGKMSDAFKEVKGGSR